MSERAVSDSREVPRGKAAGKAVRRVFMVAPGRYGVELLVAYQQNCALAKCRDVW